ncbi:MAG: hypothetical protein R3300_08890 [Candidatus Promineifilaceae bacterium]|nr:hypothetical protein [Candidatus Promineifilaceae bacterium]
MKTLSGRRIHFIGIVISLLLAAVGLIQQTVTQELTASSPLSGVERTPDERRVSVTRTARQRQLEEQILGATVRLEITVWAPKREGGYALTDQSLGHATIIDGRYLVTHNHFSLTLADLNDGKLRKLSAYGPDGQPVLLGAPFHTFEVIVASAETLVFDFGTRGRLGALDYIGLDSAELANWDTLELKPGTQVAQVLWDGQTTSVAWVTITDVYYKDGTAVVELDSFARQGASGGGIFYQGAHIGNNWYQGTELNAVTREVSRQFTVAALNGADVVELAQARADAAAVTDSVQEAPDQWSADAGTVNALIQ